MPKNEGIIYNYTYITFGWKIKFKLNFLLKCKVKGKKKEYELVEVNGSKTYSQELIQSIHKAADNRREMQASKTDEETIAR